MLSLNGFILRILRAIPLPLLLLLLPLEAECQTGILDSAFTFRAVKLKTVDALGIITKQTGFNFTYDSRLIDEEKITGMTFTNIKLRAILDSILMNKTLVYSVIDKYIIISRAPPAVSPQTDSTQSQLKYIAGIIVDNETLEPLQYATIGLKNKGKGTVSNINGEFAENISRPPQ